MVHRRSGLGKEDAVIRRAIPVTSVLCTIIDLAPRLPYRQLEAVVNDADRLDLIDPEALRHALKARPGRPGVGVLGELLDRQTFTLTDSELERLFLPIARRAGALRPFRPSLAAQCVQWMHHLPNGRGAR